MGLNWMMNAVSVGEKTLSIIPSFTALSSLSFKSFVQKVTLWFNTTNNSQISPTTEELLFGINTNSSGNNNAIKKFNYTTLFMRYYIYTPF